MSLIPELFLREALAFLGQRREQPFLLYVPFNAPHNASNLDPFIRAAAQGTEPYKEMYPDLQAQAGSVCDGFCSSLDLLPTLLQATGTAKPKNLIFDGYDILPLLSGAATSPRGEMFWQRRGDKAARVVRVFDVACFRVKFANPPEVAVMLFVIEVGDGLDEVLGSFRNWQGFP